MPPKPARLTKTHLRWRKEHRAHRRLLAKSFAVAMVLHLTATCLFKLVTPIIEEEERSQHVFVWAEPLQKNSYSEVEALNDQEQLPMIPAAPTCHATPQWTTTSKEFSDAATSLTLSCQLTPSSLPWQEATSYEQYIPVPPRLALYSQIPTATLETADATHAHLSSLPMRLIALPYDLYTIQVEALVHPVDGRLLHPKILSPCPKPIQRVIEKWLPTIQLPNQQRSYTTKPQQLVFTLPYSREEELEELLQRITEVML